LKLSALLSRNRSDLALLIGNGINRHGAPSGANSWDELLSTLARRHLNRDHKTIPRGISLTEFYDILELASSSRRSGTLGLQRQFCDLMQSWTPLPQHAYITAWAQRHRAPVLTTNFDSTLSDAAACSLRRVRGAGFTAFYPWDSYYGNQDIADPCKQFAIWHVNGMQRYRQSIRLGLSHYMGSVERARSWMHKGGRRLLNTQDIEDWAGSATWLQVLLHKPLLIIGLGLSETEVFLRWLLIERAKYFKVFPRRRKRGWYVHVHGDIDAGKALFLKAVGIEPTVVTSYDEIYAKATWSGA
jgi:hypothetical protein